MTRPKLTLFLDVISPFAYMAFYVTKNSPTFKQCDVNYIPIFLGGVMKATGNRPPIEIKNKDKWIEVERKRWARLFKIPIAPDTPSPFPQSTLNTQRALCAINLLYPEKLTAAFDVLYHAFWVERQTIGKPEVITAALGNAFSKDEVKSILEKMGSPEAKKLLLDNSDLAVREGAFGLPWFLAVNAKGEKEGFWGFDHLGQVIDHLGLERVDRGLQAML